MLLSDQKWLCRLEYLIALARYSRSVDSDKLDKIAADIAAGKIGAARKDAAIGHIYVYGSLVSQPDPMSVLFGRGYTTYQSIQEAAAQAAASDAITSVYIHINSPGGTVDGVDETWKALRALAENKTLIAINEGEMASAAYWLASAANKIYSVGETNEQGSIGVVAGYLDYTKYDEKLGILEKVFTSKNAKLKHPQAEGAQPGYDKALQKTLDDLEDIFIDRISQGRGLSADYVSKNFGKGGMLLSKDAAKVKMIDGIKSLSEIYSMVNTSGAGAVSVETCIGDNEVDPKEMLSNPFVMAEIDRRVDAADKAGYDRGRKEQIAIVEKAMAFINTNSYPEKIRALAVDVCRGVKSFEAFEMVVQVFDQLRAVDEVSNAQQTEQNAVKDDNAVSIMPKVVAPKERSVDERVKALKGEVD